MVNPPPQFTSPTGGSVACLRPYDGPDAQNVIAAVNSRATGHRTRASISASSGNVLAGMGSIGNIAQVGGTASATPLPTVSTSSNSISSHARTGSRTWKKPIGVDTSYGQPVAGLSLTSPLAREPSPSLPSLPSHPTLGSLISSSLTDTSIAS